jgi:hypothetical protein
MAQMWGFLGVVVVALIGGGGVTGLLAGVFDLSKRNRLRRRVERASELRKLLPDGSPERGAIQHAVALDATRLAALSAVGTRRALADAIPTLITVGFVLVLVLVAAGVGLVRGLDEGYVDRDVFEGLGLPGAAAIASLVGAFIAFLFLPRSASARRRVWVEHVVDGADPAEETKAQAE